MNSAQLATLAQSWRRRLVAREALLAVGGSLLIAASTFRLSGDTRMASALVFALGWLAYRLVRLRPWKFTTTDFTRHLDRNFAPLEESSALWLRVESDLSGPERWQLKRLNRASAALESEVPPISFLPAKLLGPGWIGLIAGGMALLLVEALRPTHHPVQALTTVQPAVASLAETRTGTVKPSLPRPKISQVSATITPPGYTGRPLRRIASWDLEVEEGGRVEWTITTENGGESLALVWSNGTQLELRSIGAGQFSASQEINRPEVYHLSGVRTGEQAWTPDELHSIKVIKDQPPAITMVLPELPRTVIGLDQATLASPRVEVRVTVRDDYGLTESHLVATVAKGSGEGVKFREQRIAFAAESGTPAQMTWSRTLDLRELGMAPGDELYFYVVAQDNRQPRANESRSETRFISWAGPVQASAPAGGPTGVNLVPAYFRSQRQLIIDTEKLLADRSTLSEGEFERRSENLGIDQKLLRLRYGQFLGEEFEPDKANGSDTPAPGAVSALPAQLQHRHEITAEEASRAPSDSPVVAVHDHEEEPAAQPGVQLSAKEILAPYTHQHDKADEATFFEDAQKSSLRDVLAAMWEAEGRLRTVQPASALPAENRALTILKALQESARAYVQRVGFEATPLKVDERRLKGELDDVPLRRVSPPVSAAPGPDRESIVNTLKLVLWSSDAAKLASDERTALAAVEAPLTRAATSQPERFLAGLQALRNVLGEEERSPTELRRIREALWQLAPQPEHEADRRRENASALGTLYFRALTEEDSP